MNKLKFRYFILIIILLILPSFFIFNLNPSNSFPILNNLTNKSSTPKDSLSYASNSPPNGIIYANNSIFLNNTYAIRLDGGYTYLDGGYNITSNNLNGTPVLNSTVIQNSQILNYTYLISINLLNNAKLLLRNIIDPELNIFVFDNSELILEKCLIKAVIAFDNSTIWVRNSTITNIADLTVIISPSQFMPVRLARSNIHILNNSFITQVTCLMGSTCGIDNSTISKMYIGGVSSGLSMGFFFQNLTEPYNSALITNSTITDFQQGGISSSYIFGSNITSVKVRELSNLTLDTTYLKNLTYGIICNNNTNISNGIPSGTNYSNNTFLIATNPTVSNLSYIAVNKSSVFINGWPSGLPFKLIYIILLMQL